jgi:hypothetical protein
MAKPESVLQRLLAHAEKLALCRRPTAGHLPSVLPLNFRHLDTGYEPRKYDFRI